MTLDKYSWRLTVFLTRKAPNSVEATDGIKNHLICFSTIKTFSIVAMCYVPRKVPLINN